jgi:hypothetical protein
VITFITRLTDISKTYLLPGDGNAMTAGQITAGDITMTGHGAKFGRKKEEAIAALISQRSIEEAARSIGIGTKTLWRWLQVPEFDAAYREARRDAFSQSIARLQQASGATVSTLLRMARDPGAVRICQQIFTLR